MIIVIFLIILIILLLKEESFLVRFLFSKRTLQDNMVLIIKNISGFYEAATGTWTLLQA